MKEVFYMSWEEYESGWGLRPDGCSLHLTPEDYAAFEKANFKPEGDEYSKPAGKLVTAKVSDALHARITPPGLRLQKQEERDAAKSGDLQYGEERSGWVSN